MNLRMLTGVVLAVLAASGCGLKGPLYLPEKSDVTIRPTPAATAPEAPAEPAPTTAPAPTPEQATAPEQAPQPEQPPQDPAAGPSRG